jgi:hypothetical protein
MTTERFISIIWRNEISSSAGDPIVSGAGPSTAIGVV